VKQKKGIDIVPGQLTALLVGFAVNREVGAQFHQISTFSLKKIQRRLLRVHVSADRVVRNRGQGHAVEQICQASITLSG
jgi:hypothetical protein